MEENLYWGLKGLMGSVKELIFKKILSLNDDEIFNAFAKFFIPMLKVMFTIIVNNSVLSKNHWMRFVTGERREVAYGKSGGTFMVKRYL